LWIAFNSLSARWAYDRNADTARRIPDTPGTELATELVRIPTGRERVLDWMRSFAGTQSPSTQAQLSTILAGDSPSYRFKGFVIADPNLNRAWRRYHIQQVVAAIEAWAAANDLHPKDVTSPFRGFLPRSDHRAVYPAQIATLPVATQVETPTPAPPVENPQTTSPGLTPRLPRMIDDLIGELLRLRGALEVIDPKN